jgi:aminopeptidase N
MSSRAKTEIFLKDYKAPAFLIPTIALDIDVQADHATVTSTLKIVRNKANKDKKAPLVLNGEDQKLISLSVDGVVLEAAAYTLTDYDLTIPNLPDEAELQIISTHNPYANTALAGLYKAGPMLNTQCEPEGFRRITYHPDRPDVMSVYTVTLHAAKKAYPVLLANGNLLESGDEGAGRHYAVWHDPFPKPSYLFACVMGNLDKTSSSYKTKSGRKVLLEIYVEKGKTDQVALAMRALKNSMKWDEDTYGLEYDLDRFMIVGTPFFNMGAMENKGLNIFNDVCLIGTPETAPDSTLSFIEAVVAHEYFHNWTGNRITCRDWFQLSLKEGLTVYRDQEFSSDMNSRAIERLGNVRALRRSQFAEDAGTMSHPVRPDRYQEIDNFYTTTVYEKGAEVVRMYRTLFGVEGFRKGMDLYVKRHDGQAVTCDDFAQAMYDANKKSKTAFDLKQFMLWYSQSGTPRVDVKSKYDAKAKTLTLKVTQSCPPTPNQPSKKPFFIPLAVGLIGPDGKDVIGTKVLTLSKKTEEFVFKNIKPGTVPSLLRDFSAPVILSYPYTTEDLTFLVAHDSDPFCKWEAGFTLATQTLLAMAEGKKVDLGSLTSALQKVLRDKSLDPAFKAMMLSLPAEAELGQSQRAIGKAITVDALYKARKTLAQHIATALVDDFAKLHSSLKPNPKGVDGKAMGIRSLKNLCLSYMAEAGHKDALKLAYTQATTSPNMTEQLAALSILVEAEAKTADKALAAFARKWGKVPSIMDKWLSAQSGTRTTGGLDKVRALMSHKAFDLTNPNRVSALLGVAAANWAIFHAKDGSGYKFIADQILAIDKINAHSAARLVKNFTTWRDFDEKRQGLMKKQLDRLAKAKLSSNCAEIVGKTIG